MASTLILGAVFVFVVANGFRLPKFDDTILLMMGLINGLYVGLKLQEGTKGAATEASKGKKGKHQRCPS